MFVPTTLLALALFAQPTPDSDGPSQQPSNAPPIGSREAATPATLAGMAAGQSARVGGDLTIAVTEKDGQFFSGRSSITTPLPTDYPAPTPPGAIDIKRYPTVRRAQVSGETSPDIGMNVGFFPLFNHIKRRDIPMTSPVEMEYQGLSVPPASKATPEPADGEATEPAKPAPTPWTMAFLYRTADEGEAGADKADNRVQVVDAPEVLVISVGLRGTYGRVRIERGLALLREWLGSHPEWKVTGEARGLYYNGPEVANRDRWLEVQLPIAPATPPTPGSTHTPPPTPAPAADALPAPKQP